MDTKPQLSIIMPVYNAARFLQEAIDSILHQSYGDFEFLIFNDGSTDDSKKIIESYSDPRIKFFDDPVNRGYVDRLNAGIDSAQGKYIARMDADDVAMPNRFKTEIAVLDGNKEIGMVGSSVALIDERSIFKNSIWNFGALSSEIPAILLFTNYFAHPTVMYRSEVVKKIKYDITYMPSEDFKLWTEISSSMKSYSIRRPLLFYRQHSQNTALVLQSTTRLQVIKILGEQLKKIGVDATEDQVLFHNSLSFDKNLVDKNFIDKTKAWYEEIFFANVMHGKLDEISLGYALLGRWSIWSGKYDKVIFPLSKTFWSSKIIRYFIKDYSKLFKLLFRMAAIIANKILSAILHHYEMMTIILWKKRHLKRHV